LGDVLFCVTGEELWALGVLPPLAMGVAAGVPLLDDGAGVADGVPLLGLSV